MPVDILLHIASFIQPSDIRALSLVNRSFAFLANDERLFCALYKRDYVPYIRMTTQEDIEMNISLANDKLCYEFTSKEYVRRRLDETSLSNESVQSFQDLSQYTRNNDESWSWKSFYTVLFETEKAMLQKMRKLLGFHTSAEVTKSPSISYTFLFTGIFDETMSFHHIIYSKCMVKGRSINFMPDYIDRFFHIKAKHLDFAHQILMLRSEIEVDGNDTIFDDVFTPDKPPKGMWNCISEGIVRWNKALRRHVLVYPLSAVRLIFHKCRSRALREHEEAAELTQAFLKQIVTITYLIKCSMKLGSLSQIMTALVAQLTQNELETTAVNNIQLLGDSSALLITVTCKRQPEWKSREGICLGHEHIVLEGIQIIKQLPCLVFCDTYPQCKDVQGRLMTEQRQTLLDTEFLYYAARPNLEIKKHFTLGTLGGEIPVETLAVDISTPQRLI